MDALLRKAGASVILCLFFLTLECPKIVLTLRALLSKHGHQHAIVSFSRDVLYVLTLRLACNGLFSTLSVMIYCNRMGFRSEGEKSPTVDPFLHLSSYFLT